ncbi:T9SS type A sorting domain-containing protein [Paraflavisolibacter sp. H34]|uniref:T9SS type A sorting domain-containing protein n=1 Tax=Huijunlia imazamoxiresistens TaxID=3127457 RepID=UPI00301748DF
MTKHALRPCTPAATGFRLLSSLFPAAFILFVLFLPGKALAARYGDKAKPDFCAPAPTTPLPDTTRPLPGPVRPSPTGFSSVTPLQPLPLSSHILDKPQAKLWTYAGKWWAVLPTLTGTKIFRLEGTSWVEALHLTGNANSKADCRVAGNLAHILLFRGRGIDNSYLVSVEYDSTSGNYKLWSKRRNAITINFEPGAETATLDLDSTGRMWIASESSTDVLVRWSDAPYAAWSAPITIASGIAEDDICALAALPGKIGVLWSNQNTQRFGFKTHADGTDPAAWSEDELPAAREAQNIRHGLADDHLNLMVGSDGILYCAVKTGFDTPGLTKLALLVRRPSGHWDDLYPITLDEGTRPFILLNEAQRKLKVAYTSEENGGEILYRETFIPTISFGGPKTLISRNDLCNYVSSTHQPYTREVVLLANTVSVLPLQAVGIIGRDEESANPPGGGDPPAEPPVTVPEFQVTPNPFTATTQLSFSLVQTGQYLLQLLDSQGRTLMVLGSGRAEGGKRILISLENARLPQGLYFVQLRTPTFHRTLKIIKGN